MATQTTTEIQDFIARVGALPAGPGVSLDAVLQPSLDDEAELRKLFATDRQNLRLSNTHVGLIDIFSAPDAIRTTRARVVENNEDLNAHHVVPLSTETRRKEGLPCMVSDLDEFKLNWSIFTEGSLSQLVDWNNVVAAGGSVLACLTPLDEADKTSKRAIRKYYHSNAYPTSDVDLFLWGMTPEQAEAKIKVIYEAVRDSVPWDVTCIRTKHTVSIHSQYPYRSVQIVLRLYQSPAEILAGFDIDAPCCAYDGTRVWANPRSVVAMMRQCNTVDVTRRSPSYEIRLIKYSQRAFEIYVPTLRRAEIDPTIFERAIARMEGLARLLVLEKLGSELMRTAFLAHRRTLRGRPATNTGYSRRHARKYKGDLKVETGLGIEMNDYDVASLHIPYGPGWDARKIDKLVYQTDLGMNSTFNPKNKGRRLHRHPAFFGTINECLEDCCENCPQPIDKDEKKLKQEEDEIYVCGRIKFVEENPGRQSMTGSFKPIDDGEWSDQVYIKPTQQLFIAIAAHDRTTVQKLLQEGIDVNQRDYVGRTTLHLAIFTKATDIACDLIDAGARITARLADGRAPLHLAAQYDLPVVIKKLFDRNTQNKDADNKKKEEEEDKEKAMDTKDTAEKASSEDDWSSHDDEDVVMSDADDEDDEEEDSDEDDDDDENSNKKATEEKAEEAGEIPEEKEDQPDIIEVDAYDWDVGLSAIAYAVLYASITTLDALIEGGADATVPTKQGDYGLPLHPLTLTILRQDEDEACKVAERLLQVPSVTCTTANPHLCTIFHYAVASGRTKIVETMLRCDPHATMAVNFPSVQYINFLFPVTTAISQRNFAILGIMLAYGAKLELSEEDVTKALDVATPAIRQQVSNYGGVKNYLHSAYQPLEIATQTGDDIAKLLIVLGASTDFGLKRTLTNYSNVTERRTLKDWVDYSINSINVEVAWKNTMAKRIAADAAVAPAEDTKKQEMDVAKTGWKAFHQQYFDAVQREMQPQMQPNDTPEERAEREAKRHQDTIERLAVLKNFFLDIQTALTAHDAKTWKDVYPTVPTEARSTRDAPVEPTKTTQQNPFATKVEEEIGYIHLNGSYQRVNVPQHLTKQYDDLYEACYTGDNARIQRLCLPVDGQEDNVSLGLPLPLNISVKMIDSSMSQYSYYGYTPFFAAISGRKWSTAKLILAIATAQYAPDNKKDEIKFRIDIDSDDEDSDEDSDDGSDISEITIEQEEIKFIDIATGPSAVRSEVHPQRLLQELVRWAKPKSFSPSGPYSGLANPLQLAIIDNDLEAFVHIANLYDTLPTALELPYGTLELILQHDRPEILDEFIRRTGAGVDIDDARNGAGGEEDLPAATNDSNKMYLGLNVHGKKRMDLARKNDPDANDGEQTKEHPIVWKAILAKAKGAIDYLGSDRPATAYKFYANSHSDPKALWFRRILEATDAAAESKLEKQLPRWLGWTMNSLGESPLIVGILSDDVDIVKQVAKLEPNLTIKALQTRIKFVGVNPLMLAVRKQCSAKIMDYLLSRKVSATERTLNDGWNIYHHICELNNGDLLEYFLNKLPKDVNATLLAQQSKPRLNTPLHIAVKKGAKRLVKLLLEHDRSTLLVRDVDGQIPLHCAVKSSWIDITKQLLNVSPPEALYTEDTVGNILLDNSAVAELTIRLRGLNAPTFDTPEATPSSHETERSPMKVFVENEDKITEMLESLTISQGKYKAKIISAVTKWASEREKKLVVYKARQAVKDKEEEERNKKVAESLQKQITNPIDHGNVREVWVLVCDAIKAYEAAAGTEVQPKRQLIHLFEVQQSVHASLARVRGKLDADDDDDNRYSRRSRRERQKAEDELAPEEDKTEKNAKKASMVFQYLRNGADTY